LTHVAALSARFQSVVYIDQAIQAIDRLYQKHLILIIRTVVNVENIATHLETLFFVLLR